MDQEIEKRLWEYIDGTCTENEKRDIQRELAENHSFRIRYTELMMIHDMLNTEELEMPSMRFSKNVMEEIAHFKVAPATRNYINKNVIRGISAFFLIMIAGLFFYFLGQIHWSGAPSDKIIPEYNLDASKLSLGKLMNNAYVTIFMGISIILGLILIDKFLLSKRNRSHVG